MPWRDREPVPPASGNSPVVTPVSTTTRPFAPTAPRWMCAMVIVLVTGKLATCIWNNATALDIAPPESRVMANSMVTVPDAIDSGPVTGGTSLAGDNCAVNRAVSVLGRVGESLLQAATNAIRIDAATPRRIRVMNDLLEHTGWECGTGLQEERHA